MYTKWDSLSQKLSPEGRVIIATIKIFCAFRFNVSYFIVSDVLFGDLWYSEVQPLVVSRLAPDPLRSRDPQVAQFSGLTLYPSLMDEYSLGIEPCHSGHGAAHKHAGQRHSLSRFGVNDLCRLHGRLATKV